MIAARPHQRLWTELLTAPAPVTAGELSTATGASFQTADFRLDLWVRAGLVERRGRRPHRYRLAANTERTPLPPAITATGRALPRPPATYQRLWTAMRVLRTFDIPILAITAEASENAVRGYIGLLRRAGYIKIVSAPRGRAGARLTYALIRNTGRHAPRERLLVIQRGVPGERRELHDPNTGTRVDVTPSRKSAPPDDRGVS